MSCGRLCAETVNGRHLLIAARLRAKLPEKLLVVSSWLAVISSLRGTGAAGLEDHRSVARPTFSMDSAQDGKVEEGWSAARRCFPTWRLDPRAKGGSCSGWRGFLFHSSHSFGNR